MTSQFFEFTAISESSLVASNNIGSSLGCGDTFKMPTYSDVCITVSDNDSKLSGDACHNENADDWHGQDASIQMDGVEAGNGGQIYAEKYFWAYDSSGTWFKIIEIEQEGSSDDYYAFYTGSGYGIPAPGTELTIHSACNVKSEWIGYGDLDGGEKAPEPVDPACEVITLEAEDFHLSKFVTEHSSTASEGEIVKLYKGDGELSKTFNGGTGTYQVSLFAQDESDGQSMIKVFVGGELVSTITLDQDNNGGGSNNGSFSEIDLGDIAIEQGDQIRIEAWKDCGEFVRLDKVVLTKVDCDPVDNPDAPICEEFNGTFPIDSNLVVSDDHWAIKGGEAVANGRADGSLTFSPIDVAGQTKVSFDIRTDNVHPFETADKFIVEVKLDDGSFEVLDVFRRDGDVFVGSITGQTYGEADATVGYIVGDAGTSTVQLRLTADFSWVDETVIVDDVCFEPACDDVKETFDSLSAGDVASDFDGFTVVAQRDRDPSANDAMIFDTTNPTGGDNDLRYTGKGNVIIISEDNDSSDPDDNADGGTITFTFDAPSSVTSIEVLDIEETSGTIDLFDADGNLIDTVAIPATGNNGAATVFINANDVAEMVVNLPGSGAVNDLCFEPGVVELAGLGDFVFFDTNANGVQDVGDVAAENVLVELKDAAGTVIDSTTTDANGFYSFTDLIPGTYSVQFTAPAGFEFTITNQGGDDTLDSDADTTTGMTQTVTLAGGEFNGTLDAGLVAQNTAPDAVDDAAGKVCANELATVDVLDNDTDADGDTLTVTAVNGTTISEGQTIVLDGVNVTLTGGELVFDGEARYEALDLGQEADVTYTYTISDGQGGSDTANLDLTFCGAAEDVSDIYDFLSETPITFQIIDENDPSPSSSEAFTVQVSGSGLPGIDGIYAEAYCLSQTRPIDAGQFGTDINLAPIVTGTLQGAEDSLIDPQNFYGPTAIENLDLITWIINQDFGGQAATGSGETFTDGEIQAAIWAITEDVDFDVKGRFLPAGAGDEADAQEIVDLALDNGDGFVADEGDLVGLVLTPSGDEFHKQPFIIAVEYDDYDCLC